MIISAVNLQASHMEIPPHACRFQDHSLSSSAILIHMVAQDCLVSFK